ncbi:hypothetical protein K1719_047248 [Acacia pycnantha]|nr:hypothetical protein K1719_047248 [Acacia pycnantha]
MIENPIAMSTAESSMIVPPIRLGRGLELKSNVGMLMCRTRLWCTRYHSILETFDGYNPFWRPTATMSSGFIPSCISAKMAYFFVMVKSCKKEGRVMEKTARRARTSVSLSFKEIRTKAWLMNYDQVIRA